MLQEESREKGGEGATKQRIEENANSSEWVLHPLLKHYEGGPWELSIGIVSHFKRMQVYKQSGRKDVNCQNSGWQMLATLPEVWPCSKGLNLSLLTHNPAPLVGASRAPSLPFRPHSDPKINTTHPTSNLETHTTLKRSHCVSDDLIEARVLFQWNSQSPRVSCAGPSQTNKCIHRRMLSMVYCAIFRESMENACHN